VKNAPGVGSCDELCEEKSMKKSLLTIGVATTLMFAWSIGRVQGQQDQSKGKVVFVSADQANFHETIAGVSMAAIWGDADKGGARHIHQVRASIRCRHAHHTNDVWIVVVKGAYLYKDAAGDKRVGPGSFLRVSGGWKHWSGGDPKDGALFYEESSDKFDTIPAK